MPCRSWVPLLLGHATATPRMRMHACRIAPPLHLSYGTESLTWRTRTGHNGGMAPSPACTVRTCGPMIAQSHTPQAGRRAQSPASRHESYNVHRRFTAHRRRSRRYHVSGTECPSGAAFRSFLGGISRMRHAPQADEPVMRTADRRTERSAAEDSRHHIE